jgi:hypothetical protein
VFIRNTDQFIDRINRSLLGFSYGLIDYINFNNLTEKDRFAFRNLILQKDPNTFGHQQELRIYNTHYAITNNKILDDPTIEDIAEIYSIIRVNHNCLTA